MKYNFHFNQRALEALVGGLSAVDFPRLNIQSLDQAYKYIKAYGYDVSDEEDLKKLWAYHQRAVTYIKTQLLQGEEVIPETLVDRNKLKDLAYLLIYASTKASNKEDSLQVWACGILRVMHILTHLDNDLFTTFSSDIQDQIFNPFYQHIHTDPVMGTFLGNTQQKIPLKKFETKAFKKTDSAITKLLIKKEAVAFRLLDKIGVRIITKTIFDIFQVMRYLVNESIISLPHLIPDQSNNTIYPVNLFLEVMESLTDNKEIKIKEIDKRLKEKLEMTMNADLRKKYNEFSSQDYRFLKFISRQLVHVKNNEGQDLSFFYPYEVQIMDYETYLNNLSGSADHEEYKSRQLSRARARVFPSFELDLNH